MSLALAVVNMASDDNPLLEAGDVVFVPKAGSVYVMGEVKQAGSIPFEPGLTVLKAVSISGGVTEVASLKGAFVRRIEGGAVRKVRVALSDTLKPDDVLEIPVRFW